jgi:hypothetical protein
MPTISIDVPKLRVVEEVKYYWCYAATESILRKAFGKADISQTEIAHNCYLRVAKTNKERGGDLGKMTTYAQLAVAQVQNETVENVKASWQHIMGTVDQIVSFDDLDLGRDGLRRLLQSAWGEFDRTLFTYHTETSAGTLQVISHIGEGGLVAVANQVHWKVIYGFDYVADDKSDDEESKYRYLVYDPENGKATQPRAKGFNEDLTDVVYISA